MDGRLRAGKPLRFVTSHGNLALYPHSLSGTESEYWPNCNDALRLETKSGRPNGMVHSTIHAHVDRPKRVGDR